MRMLVTAQPLVRRWAAMAGSSWRTLAPPRCFHDQAPAVFIDGAGLQLARSMGGTSGKTALSRLLESCVSAARRANVGDDSMALMAVTA
jgi:hypothetical protein